MGRHMVGNFILPSHHRALFFKKGCSSAKLGANPAGSGVGMVGHGV